MKIPFVHRSISAAVFVSILCVSSVFATKPSVELRVLGTFDHGAATSSEIVAYDPESQRLFVVNGATSTIDVLDASDPSDLSFLFSIDVSQGPDFQANSVDVCDGIVAAAIQNDVKTSPGTVKFFDVNGNLLNSLAAGALPDMLTFTPNCQKVLVANEGEPNSYNQPASVDPEGTVTIVDLANGVANAIALQVNFHAFENIALDSSVRIYGPNASRAQDFEPEYIAVDHNSKTAWVTLQENNAIATLDLRSGTFTSIKGLGFKDYSTGDNRLDASDRDAPDAAPSPSPAPTPNNNGEINIRHWPVFGMYQPDAISSLKYKNQTFLVTANEGDARDYTGFAEEARVGSLNLDAAFFPGYDVSSALGGLKHPDSLGRLNVTRALGNIDQDADYEQLYTLGGRSFSIWDSNGEQIFDSGDALEQITAAALPSVFNASNDNNNFDDRSDNKGPEPEAVTVGKAYGRTYVFVGLERIGGIVVYDVTNPYDVKFVQYINNRDFTKAVTSPDAKDLGPEGIHFISEEASPTGTPMLAVANEVSGTTTMYLFVQKK